MFSGFQTSLPGYSAARFQIGISYPFIGQETVSIDSGGGVRIPRRFWNMFRPADRKYIMLGTDELSIEFDERSVTNHLKSDSVVFRLWPWIYFKEVAIKPYRDYTNTLNRNNRMRITRFFAGSQPLKLSKDGRFNIEHYPAMLKDREVVMTPVGSYFFLTRPSDHYRRGGHHGNSYIPQHLIEKPTGSPYPKLHYL